MDTTPESGRCSLRKCIQGDLELGMARVEVKSFVVKADERKHMEVSTNLIFFAFRTCRMWIRIVFDEIVV